MPTVTFTLKNVSDQKLVTLQINALFRRVPKTTSGAAASSPSSVPRAWRRARRRTTLTIKSQLGYTGSDQSRQEMLQNTHFVDAKVELFAKYGSTQWKRLGEYPIARNSSTHRAGR